MEDVRNAIAELEAGAQDRSDNSRSDSRKPAGRSAAL
jgi:hypothetical protein